MIKNMLERRKESDPYLATFRRHHSAYTTLTSRFPLVTPANTSVSLSLQLMKATVLLKVSSSSVHSRDVYGK